VQSGELGEPICGVQSERSDQELYGDSSRHTDQQSYRRAEIDAQTPCANSGTSAEQRKRPLRLLMTDQSKAALER
jgi:hypothetical protein